MKVDILQIVKNVVKWNDKLEIYTNGEDNAYPERIDRLINNSITAKMASDLMLQYIIGGGLGNADNYKVSDKQKLIDFASDVAEDIIKQRGVFIHFDYDLTFEPVNPKVLPFERCRIGKKDSNDYNGKILYKVDWNDKKEKAIIFDVYNNDKKIVEAQFKKAGSIQKYKGQVLFINLDRNYIYPLSRIDAVMNDCDSEAQASIYRNQLLRKGFFGKQLIVTPPLITNDEPEFVTDANGVLRRNIEWQRKEDEATRVKSVIESFIGAENAGGAMLMQLPDFEGKIDDIFQIKRIESELDDKMFEYTENQTSKNILMTFNNLPVGLVKSPDSALFGNSGESLKAMQEMYWKNCDKDRKIVETIINDIVQNQENWQGGYIKFIKLGTDDTISNTSGNTAV
jgi:ribosomal protein L17